MGIKAQVHILDCPRLMGTTNRHVVELLNEPSEVFSVIIFLNIENKKFDQNFNKNVWQLAVTNSFI